MAHGRMTEMSKIYGFERDPYLRELDVTILEIEVDSEGPVAYLDDTILYPEGGGQPSDRGWLDGVTVVRVEKGSGGPGHLVERPIAPGGAKLVVDWDRRYDHMQQHTAQHLLTRAALDRFGWATRSFHIGPKLSDIELDCPPPQRGDIEDLEDAVAEIIGQARPIRCLRVSPEEYSGLEIRSRGLPDGHSGDIRLVEIEGFDLNTCGGTHVASTAEVEMLKVVSSESLRGGCRLHWVAGRRVRSRFAAHEERLAQLRKLLDTGDEDLVAGVGLKMEQLTAARRARRWLEKRLAEALAEDLVACAQTLVELHLQGPEAPLLRGVAESFANRSAHQIGLLTASSEGGDLFALVLGKEVDLDLKAVGTAVAEALGGRGGGGGRVFQGKAPTLGGRDQALLALEKFLS